jgi:hypothetical protein
LELFQFLVIGDGQFRHDGLLKLWFWEKDSGKTLASQSQVDPVLTGNGERIPPSLLERSGNPACWSVAEIPLTGREGVEDPVLSGLRG